MGSPWEMYLLNDYLARIKSGYVYGYTSKVFLFPDLKLGRLTHTLSFIQEQTSLLTFRVGFSQFQGRIEDFS